MNGHNGGSPLTPSDVEGLVDSAGKADWNATNILTKWVNCSPVAEVGRVLIEVLKDSKNTATIFYALTTLEQKVPSLSASQQAQIRQFIYYQSKNGLTLNYMAVKLGVVMAALLKEDFNCYPHFHSQSTPNLYLQTLDALFSDESAKQVKLIRDYVRGFFTDINNPTTTAANNTDASQTISAHIANTTLEYMPQHPVLALRVCVLLVSWIHMSLVELIIPQLWPYLAATDDPKQGELVMETLTELVSRGARQIPLEQIVQRVNLQTLDASPIEVVIAVAKFINTLGCEAGMDGTLLQIFLQCFMFDDIDVSGAVIPLASKIVGQQDTTSSPENNNNMLPQILEIMFRQMRYPPDFNLLDVDSDDDIAAEEEQYRTELRKLYQKIVRTNPDLSLQCVVQALASLPVPISASATMDIEVALRLLYHYCEGIRPSPGLKVVMKNPVFCSTLQALHQSDICQHEHPQILLLYYDICVRYSPIFIQNTDLLPPVLGALSGPRGLQADVPKVRSRSCYFLLKFVTNVISTMEPFVETAVSGIQTYLANAGNGIRQDDALYLFETTGLLLGKTNLPIDHQVTSLTNVMLPHVQRIQQNLMLQQQQNDDDELGDLLAQHIMAIAYLTKGFPKPCAPEIQHVLVKLLEVTSQVLTRMTGHATIRRNSTIVWQRLVQCLSEEKLVETMRDTVTVHFLSLLVNHAQTYDDLFDISQMMNQACIKYKEKCPTDTVLLPFLKKCHDLTPKQQQQQQQNEHAPRHFFAEELQVKKLVFLVMQNIAQHNAASTILLSATNSPHLETLLRTMADGSICITEEPNIQKACLIFFRQLLEKWRTNEAEGAFSYLVSFCDRHLIPGMLQTCVTSLDTNDAMQSRVIQEFSKALWTLKAAGSAAIPGPFAQVNTAKEMNTCLRQIIVQQQQQQQQSNNNKS